MQDVSIDDFLDWMAGISVTDGTRWVLFVPILLFVLFVVWAIWEKLDLPRPRWRRRH